MEWLNYHHLLYFWTVVREGGVSRAAEKLRLAQPTVSAQVKLLEETLGQPLFDRQGRRLVLTDTGRVVYRYADEIFGIGREMMETLKGRAPGRPLQLTVGVANAVPKLIVHRLLQPALSGEQEVHLVCREDSTEALLAELATHALDVVITDVPPPPHVRVKVFGHLLGESDTSFFAPPAVAAKLRRRFPQSINDTALLRDFGRAPPQAPGRARDYQHGPDRSFRLTRASSADARGAVIRAPAIPLRTFLTPRAAATPGRPRDGRLATPRTNPWPDTGPRL